MALGHSYYIMQANAAHTWPRMYKYKTPEHLMYNGVLITICFIIAVLAHCSCIYQPLHTLFHMFMYISLCHVLNCGQFEMLLHTAVNNDL